MAGDGGSGARTFAGKRGLEMGWVGMGPERRASEHVVTNYCFIFTALFLGDGAAARNGETGPPGANRTEPEALRSLRLPVPRQPRLLDHAVAVWTKELRPVVGELIPLRQDGAHYGFGSLSERSPGRAFPAPLQDRHQIAGHPVETEEGHAAQDQPDPSAEHPKPDPPSQSREEKTPEQQQEQSDKPDNGRRSEERRVGKECSPRW